ncbi:MAG: D-cysteine desulfhydrase [Burkholderiaceae bacterium]
MSETLLNRFARYSLCHAPTPLEPMTRLSQLLGGPRLWVKRDDCTGLAGGGNKTRKLEFLLGEALAQGADCLVTHGAVQSNHVRQTAAAACRAGLACHALLERRVPDTGTEYEDNGNVLLDRIFGATIDYRPAGLDMNAEVEAEGRRLRALGRRPYVIPGGGSNPTGALGYVACALELVAQAQAQHLRIDHLITATGSAGTHAGLVAGLHAIGAELPVTGISVRQPRERQIDAVHDLAVRTALLLGAGAPARAMVRVDDAYVGPGYGMPAESTFEAIAIAARHEGLLLDPVYSGKGFAGLLGMIREGAFRSDENIVFLHTGGAIGLFAYESALRAHIGHDPR